MRTRPVLATALATLGAVALVAAGPTVAQAKTGEYLDKRIFDATPELTAGSWHLAGMTAGEIGPTLDVTVTAVDGSLPTESRAVEPVTVDAVLTLAEGETLTVHTTGTAEAPFGGGTPSVVAYFDTGDTTYVGTAHRRARIVGDGLISAGGSWFGYQATFTTTVAWAG